VTELAILVVGVGNVFLGDDGFGVEVIRRLAQRELASRVRLMDAGIRGVDLAYALLECRAAVLIDVVQRGGPPGTLYLIEPDVGEPSAEDPSSLYLDTHAMEPAKVLRFVRAMGGCVQVLRVVGCEPSQFGDGSTFGLSAPVLGAVDEAAAMVERIVGQLEAERA
jgi:hydrogenase maturation protease